MSWIANLDTRAAKWPAVVRWPYHGLKWLLILLGAYALIGTIIQRMNPEYWRDLLTIR
jgi:hypothetical protein